MATYSLATARIVLDSTGVHTPEGLIVGKVVLNVTNGEVRSLGVYSNSTRKVVKRLSPESVKSGALSFSTARDRAIVDAFVR